MGTRTPELFVSPWIQCNADVKTTLWCEPFSKFKSIYAVDLIYGQQAIVTKCHSMESITPIRIEFPSSDSNLCQLRLSASPQSCTDHQKMHAKSKFSFLTLLLLGVASAMPVDTLDASLVPRTCKGQKCCAKYAGFCTATCFDGDYSSGECVVQ